MTEIPNMAVLSMAVEEHVAKTRVLLGLRPGEGGRLAPYMQGYEDGARMALNAVSAKVKAAISREQDMIEVPDDMIRETENIFHIKVELDKSGVYIATSPEFKGLLVAKMTIGDLFSDIPRAITELRACEPRGRT